MVPVVPVGPLDSSPSAAAAVDHVASPDVAMGDVSAAAAGVVPTLTSPAAASVDEDAHMGDAALSEPVPTPTSPSVPAVEDANMGDVEPASTPPASQDTDMGDVAALDSRPASPDAGSTSDRSSTSSMGSREVRYTAAQKGKLRKATVEDAEDSSSEEGDEVEVSSERSEGPESEEEESSAEEEEAPQPKPVAVR